MKLSATIVSTGSYLPEREISNAELEQFPAHFIARIEEKTGIASRRHSGASESTSTLAAGAAQACIDSASVCPLSIDGIVLATSTPDRLIPACATNLQQLIGATNAFAFDLNSVCSGAIYALEVGSALISSGAYQRMLIVAADSYSKFLNPKDFSTYPYFGDGAGAILLDACDGHVSSQGQVSKCILHTDGEGSELIQIPAGGSKCPLAQLEVEADVFFKMDGRKVFEFAVERGSEVVLQLLSDCAVEPNEVRHVICHQANLHIIDHISEQTSIPRERFYTNMEQFGNTASASMLIAFDEISNRGISPGEKVVLVAFGGGLSWGATLLEY